MTNKPDIETSPVEATPSETPTTPETAQEPDRDTGLRASIKNAKDFVVDKMAHPYETAGEVKDWAERSARSVDAALESVQDGLASVHSSIGQARDWTADKAEQVDRVLASAQDVVTKLDDSVEAVQGSTNRVAESLQQQPEMDCRAPAGQVAEAGPRVEPDADEPDSDGAWGARTDRPER